MSDRFLHITHVSATFPPYLGGTGTVCYHNARVLAARGHKVSVYTADWEGTHDDPPGVEVHRLRPMLRVGNAPVMPGLVRLPSDATVHLHFPFYAGAELVALSRRPYIVTYHQDVKLDGLMGHLTNLHDATIGRAILKRARRICPTSIDYFRSSRFADLARESNPKLEPVPNGVDSATYHPGPVDPAIRRRFGLPENGFLLLFVGSMDRAHYFKGLPTLLRALANVPDIAALLVGEGDLREDYQRQASELGLDQRVRFAGRVDACDLPAIYRSADAFVLPSETRGEAFGVVLLEAMASGKPVIATDLPGVRTVVRNGIDGFLVPPRAPDRLARQIRDIAEMGPNQRRQIGMEGRRKVEAKYDWERIGDQLEGIYRAVQSEIRGAT
jgi:glycosyltransferase involved in cell wall biosynthesis